MAGLDRGALDRRIDIQRAGSVEDDLGTEIQSWTLLERAWARKLTQRATEVWKASGTASQREIVWQVGWTSKLATMIEGGERDRIVYQGEVFPISGVVEIGRRVGLEITTNPSGHAA